jgi:hypothetical protein
VLQPSLPFDGPQADARPPAPPADADLPLVLVRHRRARRYVIRVLEDGTVRVTVPRGGSRRFALEFARQQADWIARERARRAREAGRGAAWRAGTWVLLRGEPVALEVEGSGAGARVRLGGEIVGLDEGSGDLRPLVSRYLQRLAPAELVPRILELAAVQSLPVGRVSIRDQRSRWGSCSPRGDITLNWRLIQTPPAVRDYVLLHELMHLVRSDHSRRFWRLVERVCPDHGTARAWLREVGRGLW